MMSLRDYWFFLRAMLWGLAHPFHTKAQQEVYLDALMGKWLAGGLKYPRSNDRSY